MKIFISTEIWDDAEIEKLTDDQKLVIFWLLTNPKITVLGFIKNGERRFKYDLKIPFQVLEETVNLCQKMFSRCNGSIFIKNFIKYQYGNGLNLQKNKFWPQLEHAVETLHPLEYQELINYYPLLSKIENKPLTIPHTHPPSNGASNPPMEKNTVQAMDMDMDKDMDNKGGVGGKEGDDSAVVLPPRFPKTAEEAKAHAAFVGCSPEFAVTCWNQAVARGGCDARGNLIHSWRHHLACASAYDRERKTAVGAVNGEHRKTKEEREAEFAAGREERRRKVQEAIQNDQFAKRLLTVNKTNKESK